MPTLTPVSPVSLDNISLGKVSSVPLVAYERAVSMTVEIDGQEVAMPWVEADKLFQVKVNGYRYRANGPSWSASL
tara:strand:- start:15 stop:239 length:225 start_codon:yes stop_codon:yes gene_type:complete